MGGSGIPLWSSWDTGDAQSSISKLLILFSHSTGTERFPNRGDKPMVAVQLPSHIWLPLHGLQHTRPSCPSLSPGVCPSSCPLNRWCHPTISAMTTIVKPANTFYLFPGIIREPQSETSVVHAFRKPIWANILLLINRVIYFHLLILRFSFIGINLWDPEIQSVPVILESHLFYNLKMERNHHHPLPWKHTGLFSHVEWSQPASLCGKGSTAWGERESISLQGDSYPC